MASVASIDVVEPGDSANKLLECLRARAEPYSVGIDTRAGDGGPLMVTDMGNRTSNLWDFLEAQLDECADELKLEWERFLRVPRPA